MTDDDKRPVNPLDDKDKQNLNEDIDRATNTIKQKVLDELIREKPKETPQVPTPTVDTAAIEAQVRERLLTEMRVKMEAEAKAQESARVQSSVQTMAQELEAIKQQLAAKTNPSNYAGQDVQMNNPFDSKGKKFEDLTKADVDALDKASRIAFEKERRN